MLKILIIEDEKATRELLKELLKTSFSDIEIVGEAESVVGGVNEIKSKIPDIVLLDIDLSDGNGFEIIDKTKEMDYMVIFTTAHNEYAVKAFRISAIDYLLKPINSNDLNCAINKCKDIQEKKQLDIKLKTFFSNMKTDSNREKKIVIKSSNSINVIHIRDIIRCEADKSYTIFHLKDNKQLVASKTLKEFDTMLTEFSFFRPHQSHLININYIDSFEKPDGGLLLMSDKSHVPVASRKREALNRLFENM